MERPESIKNFKLFEASIKDPKIRESLDNLYKFLQRPGGYVDFIKKQISKATGKPVSELGIKALDQKRTGRIYYPQYGGSTYSDYINYQGGYKYTLESVYSGQVRYYYKFDTIEEVERMLAINTVYIGAELVKREDLLKWMDIPKNYKYFFDNALTRKELEVLILKGFGKEETSVNLEDLKETQVLKNLSKSFYGVEVQNIDNRRDILVLKVNHYINKIFDFLLYDPVKAGERSWKWYGYDNLRINIKIEPIQRWKKNSERWVGDSKSVVLKIEKGNQWAIRVSDFIIINDADPELIIGDIMQYYFRILIEGINKGKYNSMDKIADSEETAKVILEVNSAIIDDIISGNPSYKAVEFLNSMISKEPNKMAIVLKPIWKELKNNPDFKGIKGTDTFMKDVNLVGDLDDLGF